jgi:hypothetical protein
MPADTALKAQPLALGKSHDDRENPACEQIRYREYDQSHPPNRKAIEPFAHSLATIPYLLPQRRFEKRHKNASSSTQSCTREQGR